MASFRSPAAVVGLSAICTGALLFDAPHVRVRQSLPERAGFTGTYLRRGDWWMDYYQIAETGNSLHGFYAIIRLDAKAQGGAKTERIEVNGIADGATASLHTGATAGILSTSIGTVSLVGTTLTVRSPSADGRINIASYRRVTDEQVNAEVSALRGRTASVKQQRDEAVRNNSLRNDLARTIQEIRSLEAERPSLVAAIGAAQQQLTRAAARLNAARTAAQVAHDNANRAYRAARTPAEQLRAGQLDVQAGTADVEAGAAEVDHSTAQAELEQAQEYLRDHDRRLQQARDRAAQDSIALRPR